MASLRIVGFSGSPSRPSRTLALVETVAAEASARLGGDVQLHDLTDLGASLGSARRIADLDGPARASIDAILYSDVLVVGSPTYKGGYSGLFKHVLDLIDPLALAGKPEILTATGGGERHALVVEHQLRPLFGFFAAHSAPTGIYASDRDFSEGHVVSATVLARIAQSVDDIARLFPTSQAARLLAAE